MNLLDPYNLPPGAFFIPGQVPSSKNNKKVICKDRRGKCLDRPRLTDSDRTKAYCRTTFPIWLKQAPEFRRFTENLPKPIKVEFTFIRESNRLWDFPGPLETVLDCMTSQKFKNIPKLPKSLVERSKWIEDDSVRDILPYPGTWYKSKQNAGVIIRIL